MAHKSKKKHIKHQHEHEMRPATSTTTEVGRGKKRAGLVRSLARAAASKVTARPKRVISRVKARVNAVLGRD